MLARDSDTRISSHLKARTKDGGNILKIVRSFLDPFSWIRGYVVFVCSLSRS